MLAARQKRFSGFLRFRPRVIEKHPAPSLGT
ncbi:hypothetical protein SAMN04515668_1889 [Hymenobacter arizonensis]|uniref:Uncharacterized protein n=1 Tax=Hymenobacter arizonensis TaxID=1227077 RepID=A0A1I5XJ85_HYMAR|nr:hypothetical protein SAMN04515668_1889 [Hymenobacter arizonensis]